MPVTFVHNPDYAEGLSTSLKRGLAALPGDVDGALVCLGDMPRVDVGGDRAADRRLQSRSKAAPSWCRPAHGKRGNPVLWGKRFFAEMRNLAGDVGARHLIGAYPEAVAEIEMASDGVLTDIDTPQALAASIQDRQDRGVSFPGACDQGRGWQAVDYREPDKKTVA